MKKLLALILILATLFAFSGCGQTYKVAAPMEYPDYTFEQAPDAMQMRMTALKATRDLLTIRWFIENDIEYKHSANKRALLYEGEKTYAGLMYTKASSGLFQFLEYYNSKTGCLEYAGTADELKLELGTACADSLLWSWSTVCNSISGGFYPVLMVPANGYIPVGDYTIPEHITSYHEMPSYAIIENTPKETILDAYAKTLPADLLVSNKGDHAMMVAKEPTVVYLDGGAIDPENSYLLIQDQWSHGEEVEMDGEMVKLTGRLDMKFTFAELYEKYYIPLTAAEFIGEKAYDKAAITVSNTDCNSLEELSKITVDANYPFTVINILGIDAKGKESVLCRKLFKGSDSKGPARSFKVTELKPEQLSLAAGTVIKLEVVLSTGERFYPIEFTA
jgi:predicted small lipoprotein YifL